MRWGIVATLALCAALVSLACRDRGEAAHPNVVLVVVDTLRADRLSCQGGPAGLTPTMDRLAAEGVRFAEARAHAPWTLPSAASLLTSLHPLEHGAGGRLPLFRRLDEGVTTLAKEFRDAGYATHAVVNVEFLKPETFGVTRDFESVDAVAHDSNAEMRVARATTEAALRWLDERGDDDRPVFLVVHYFDPHCVYAPPRSFRERWALPVDRASDWTFGTRAEMLAIRAGQLDPSPAVIERAAALYDGEVAYTDAEIGRLDDGLAARGLGGEGAVLVLTADHGEEFRDHGGFEHGHTLYDELLRVPLVIRAPGVLEPRVVASPVRLIDVAPTLLELCDLALPAQFVGRSLVPLARGASEPERTTLAHGNMWAAPGSAWVAHGHKLVVREGEPPEVFDLRNDPGETRNLATEAPELLARLTAELEAVLAAMAALDRGSAATLDAQTREVLRGLGYGLGGGAGAGTEGAGR